MSESRPIVLYDDRCSLCTSFARCTRTVARGSVLLVGHYSQQGIDTSTRILDSDAQSMFWFISSDVAYGGRAALMPLLKHSLRAIFKNQMQYSDKEKDEKEEIQACTASDCSGVKHVFVRSASLIRNSKTIQINASD